MNKNEYAVYMRNLNFISRNKIILESVDASINSNENVLLLGPNGSGKSTLLKILAGLLKGSGELSIYGYPSDSFQAKRSRFYVAQSLDYPPKIKVSELMHFVQMHYHSKRHLAKCLSDDELRVNDYAQTLSVGQKKRLALVLAHLAKPKLLLLDEPDSGLDVQFRASLLKDILMNRKTQTTIMASHFFDETLSSFDRVIILKKGQIVLNTSLKFFLQIKEKITRWDLYNENPDKLITEANRNNFSFIKFSDHHVRIYIENQKAEEFKHHTLYKLLQPQNVSMEDIYLYHIAKGSNECFL